MRTPNPHVYCPVSVQRTWHYWSCKHAGVQINDDIRFWGPALWFLIAKLSFNNLSKHSYTAKLPFLFRKKLIIQNHTNLHSAHNHNEKIQKKPAVVFMWTFSGGFDRGWRDVCDLETTPSLHSLLQFLCFLTGFGTLLERGWSVERLDW